ncbi:glycoside hydrolase family 88/105 protein [Lapidilactobacillus luobeiensis]|uniref:glycoside hydrolase family 88/105 protein n=1 Tax=Lapidilactobacillus luobeiensis TaxID=2950371 RepID=UPI0021C31247|nr:glycoside hydrolase family 88 protein [Lapidilactobacillus luobeiensis]
MEEIATYLDELMANSLPKEGIVTWNQEIIRDHAEPKWDYVDGCMLLAILDMFKVTGEPKYFEFVENYVNFFVNDQGEIRGYQATDFSADEINEGKVLFALYERTGLEKYRRALDRLMTQLKYQPRTRSGNFWHKLIYPYQIWLDGLYMIQPFYLEYDQRFGQSGHVEDVIQQFSNVERYLKDNRSGLYYHAYDETRLAFWADGTTGQSPNFWTRAIGWYTMSLVDTIELLGNSELSGDLKRQLQDLAATLLRYQDVKSKMFYQVTDQGQRAGNYLETSGTCAIGYTFIKGVRLGVLPEKYLEAGRTIIQAVIDQKLQKEQERFNLTDICLVAGLGGMPAKGKYQPRDGSYEYYISEPVVANDGKGIAPLIYAYAELLAMKEI